MRVLETTRGMAMAASVVVIGKESAGKSQLIGALTGRAAQSANFRGTTVTCEFYPTEEFVFVDTPGILHQSDSATTLTALAQLQKSDIALLVVQATHIDDDLAHLLPLVQQRRGAIVVTYWDKVEITGLSIGTMKALSEEAGVPFIPVDARRLTESQRNAILSAISTPSLFQRERLCARAGWHIEPARSILEWRYVGPLVALMLLLAPALAAVYGANSFAEVVDPLVQGAVRPLTELLTTFPSPLKQLLVGSYGVITMGPLLFVWAAPTVVLFSLILGGYKASGLLDRITVALDPMIRPVGLSGRDLVRVIMGFGCNVPAVINTRACSACTRGTCISAIAFGAACSYQFGATLAVFAAAGMPRLVIPYLLYLGASTLIYTRLVSSAEARSFENLLLIEGRAFMQWPRWTSIWREASSTVVGFFKKALPIFIVICLIASLLDSLKVLDGVASLLRPLMAAFRLPPEAALPVVLASVRKDGILLFVQRNVVTGLTPLQILTGTYLAGVLLPCLVTAWTIIRERSVGFTFKLVARQMAAAIVFTMLLAHGGALLGF